MPGESTLGAKRSFVPESSSDTGSSPKMQRTELPDGIKFAATMQPTPPEGAQGANIIQPSNNNMGMGGLENTFGQNQLGEAGFGAKLNQIDLIKDLTNRFIEHAADSNPDASHKNAGVSVDINLPDTGSGITHMK